MAEQTFIERIGATPGKIALMAVLAGVFAALLIMQLGDDSSSIAIVEPSQGGVTTRAVISSRQSNYEQTELLAPLVVKQRSWPEISLKEVRAHDPFAMPRVIGDDQDESADLELEQESIRQLAEARRRALMALREKGVAIVLQSGDELVAVIGSDTVRIGDVIDGFKVVAIGPDGVKLTPNGP